MLKILGIILMCIILIQSNINLVWATYEDDKNRLTNEENQNNKKIDQVKDELEDIQKEKSETMKQVENLTTQISQYQSQINDLDSKISDLNNKISEAEANLNKTQQDYEEQQKLLQERMVATYEAGETSYLDFLLSSESITDLISNYYLVTEIATYDAELLDKIEKQKFISNNQILDKFTF